MIALQIMIVVDKLSVMNAALLLLDCIELWKLQLRVSGIIQLWNIELLIDERKAMLVLLELYQTLPEFACQN